MKFRLILIFIFISFNLFASSKIKIYEKRYIKKESYIYTNIKMDVVFGKVYKNDKVAVLKKITRGKQTYFYVELENGKKGVIRDILTTEADFPNKITFYDRLGSQNRSSLLYDLKYQEEFKQVNSKESFYIEEKSRAEDNGYFYYMTSTGFVLKLDKTDKYKIIEED